MNLGKTAVLLINLGSPDSPEVGDVRKYLTQFLNDPRVIDVNPMWRSILVNALIVPFRSSKTAKIYKQLWTESGSPLIRISEELSHLVQQDLGNDYDVFLAMRYQNPSIPATLDIIKKGHYNKIIVLPLFPQYASASTGSAHEEVMRHIKQWWVIPEVKFISQFYNNEYFIKAWVERGKEHNLEEYDHILFSYHGLPTRQVDKVHNGGKCSDFNCENEINQWNQYCYCATSFATTRLIADALKIPKSRYTVCFQSRLNDKWLPPFSDEVIIEKAKEGKKRLLVFSPAFVADCLETTIEIGVEYNELFKSHGGDELTLVESLNLHPDWIKCISSMIKI